MKKETALKLGLKLLGLGFLLGPLLIAFGMNGWDLQATLVNSQEFQEVEDSIGEMFGEQEGGSIQILTENAFYDNITHQARVPVEISLPFSFPVVLVGFEISGMADGHPVSLSMKQDHVSLLPGENVVITLEGQIDVDITEAEITQTQGTISFEKYGVTIQVVVQEMGI